MSEFNRSNDRVQRAVWQVAKSVKYRMRLKSENDHTARIEGNDRAFCSQCQ